MADVPLLPATTGRKVPWMGIAIGAVFVVLVAMAISFWMMLSRIEDRVTKLDTKVILVSQRVEGFSDALTGGKAPSSGTGGTMSANEVTRLSFGTDGGAVVYTCGGQIRRVPAQDADTRYCLGEFSLKIVQPGKSETPVTQGQADTPEHAPLLTGASLAMAGTAPDRLFISFGPNPCATVDDCGVGEPTNGVRYVVNMDTMAIQQTPNYPPRGELIWNHSAVQAVFVELNCGGAMCIAAPLQGYDLLSDSTFSITADKAGEEPDARDINGKFLPYWSDVQWVGDSDVRALIINPDGSTKKVQVPFAPVKGN